VCVCVLGEEQIGFLHLVTLSAEMSSVSQLRVQDECCQQVLHTTSLKLLRVAT